MSEIQTVKYGILLQEGQADIDKFLVVAVPRDNMESVVTKWSENDFTDENGQAAKIPEAWGNGWVVKWIEETQNEQCLEAINNAMDAFNLKYTNKITIDQLIIE